MQDCFTNHRGLVKEKHGFKNWAGKVRSFNGILCRGFLPDHNALPGYVLEARRAIPGEKYHFTDYFHRKGDPTIRFAVTIRVLPSIEEAHEGLIDILSYSMAPYLPPAEEKGLDSGDVGFTGHGNEQTLISFTRYNVLVKVESLGPKQVPVKELAELLDSQIIAFQKTSQ